MKELTWGSQVDRACTVIPGSFSVALAVVVVASVVLFKKLRTQTFYLVVFQSIAESIFNLSIIAFYNPPVHGNWQCQFQGWLVNFGIMSSIFFSGGIAGHMYLSITRRNYRFDQITLIKLTVAIIIVAGFLAAIPFTTHQYEDLNANCWLAEGEYNTSVTNGIIMRFATHYGIIWAVCIFCAWSYKTVFKYVQDLKIQLRTSVLRTTKGPSDLERTVYRLQYYPAILIFCWVGITCCRIYSSIYPNKHLPVWALCGGHAILNTQGFLNGVVFCSYRSVWMEWIRLCGLEARLKRLENHSSMISLGSAVFGSWRKSPNGQTSNTDSATHERVVSLRRSFGHESSGPVGSTASEGVSHGEEGDEEEKCLTGEVGVGRSSGVISLGKLSSRGMGDEEDGGTVQNVIFQEEVSTQE